LHTDAADISLQSIGEYVRGMSSAEEIEEAHDKNGTEEEEDEEEEEEEEPAEEEPAGILHSV
jgi:ribosomal protein L12E/L44/L45/RPP1/RPP2